MARFAEGGAEAKPQTCGGEPRIYSPGARALGAGGGEAECVCQMLAPKLVKLELDQKWTHLPGVVLSVVRG
jgi:hypothetical protein